LTYGDVAFFGYTMPALYFYAMAVVYIRLHRIRDIGNVEERFVEKRISVIS
jgi:hypothetical protein